MNNIKWKKWIYEHGQHDDDNWIFLVTDGKEIWSVYQRKGDIYFTSHTNENEYEIAKRLTHWCDLTDIPLP